MPQQPNPLPLLPVPRNDRNPLKSPGPARGPCLVQYRSLRLYSLQPSSCVSSLPSRAWANLQLSLSLQGSWSVPNRPRFDHADKYPRHGARLDAEDEQWPFSSPTPYDSPLSYGGWTQTRALGARIASLLRAWEGEPSNDPVNPISDGSRSSNGRSATACRRHQVVVHTSPFLRCIQSSIAICAGMSQYGGNAVEAKSRPSPLSSSIGSSKLFAGPARSRTLDSRPLHDSVRGTNPTSARRPSAAPPSRPRPKFQKPTLRIDACLGEWLTPDYYEFIAAPPSSNMMVAGAKAELLRSPDPLQGARIVTDEGRSLVIPGAGDKPSGLAMEQLAGELPLHETTEENLARGNTGSGKKPRSSRPRHSGTWYVPPTPMYALSSSEPIPVGYVDHARLACVAVDFQWDSMWAPQRWGDGGCYGEEWSSMHRRFRKGLSNMISWYKEHDSVYDSHNQQKADPEEEDIKRDIETALVIVTHGAGCNALIGALTNQPVLMDVGMASLTVATRTDNPTTPSSAAETELFSSLSHRRSSWSANNRLPEEFELKLIASTEHLRAGPDPLKIPQLQATHNKPSSSSATRQASSADPVETSTPADGRSRISDNNSLGSTRRTSVKSAFSTRYNPGPLTTSPKTSSGLWGDEGAGNPFVLVSNGNGATCGKHNSNEAPEGDIPMGRGGPAHTMVSPEKPAPGLWGTSPKIDSKRRWTVGERR